jgi:hypothetical protein
MALFRHNCEQVNAASRSSGRLLHYDGRLRGYTVHPQSLGQRSAEKKTDENLLYPFGHLHGEQPGEVILTTASPVLTRLFVPTHLLDSGTDLSTPVPSSRQLAYASEDVVSEAI